MRRATKTATTRDLAPNDMVNIKNGPFKMYAGYVLEILGRKVRIQSGRTKLIVDRENILPYDPNVNAVGGKK